MRRSAVLVATAALLTGCSAASSPSPGTPLPAPATPSSGSAEQTTLEVGCIAASVAIRHIVEAIEGHPADQRLQAGDLRQGAADLRLVTAGGPVAGQGEQGAQGMEELAGLLTGAERPTQDERDRRVAEAVLPLQTTCAAGAPGQ